MTLRIPAKVLLHVWSYDFYDMTLSTGKQRRHMINRFFLSFNECFFSGKFYIFLIFAQNIDGEYSLEPPRRGGSNEHPQSMFWSKNKKKKYIPAYPSFAI